MAYSKDQKRKRKLKERAKKSQPTPFLPTFRINNKAASHKFVSVVKSGYNIVRKRIYEILDQNEIIAVNNFISRSMPLGVRGRDRCGRALNKIGDAVYDHVLTAYDIPVGTYCIEPEQDATGIIDINCWSFKEHKSVHGTRYYDDNKLIISDNGAPGVVSKLKIGYTRHFLERAMERSLRGSLMQQHQTLYRSLTNQVILIKVKNIYRLYIKALKECLENVPQEVKDIKEDLFLFMGYIPNIVDEGFIVAKTILLPGMRGTPERKNKELQNATNMLNECYLRSVQRAGIPLMIYTTMQNNTYNIVGVVDDNNVMTTAANLISI